MRFVHNESLRLYPTLLSSRVARVLSLLTANPVHPLLYAALFRTATLFSTFLAALCAAMSMSNFDPCNASLDGEAERANKFIDIPEESKSCVRYVNVT